MTRMSLVTIVALVSCVSLAGCLDVNLRFNVKNETSSEISVTYVFRTSTGKELFNSTSIVPAHFIVSFSEPPMRVEPGEYQVQVSSGTLYADSFVNITDSVVAVVAFVEEDRIWISRTVN